MSPRPNRRAFLEHLSLTSAAMLGGVTLPMSRAAGSETWDMSWLDRVAAAKYRAVVDANVLEEGYAFDLASGLIDTYHEVHGVPADQVRIVIVARRGGTPLVFNDALWARYGVGEQTKQNDRDGTPMKRNPYFKPHDSVTLLVCNIAATNWSRGFADRTKRPLEEVKQDVYANFVPGTVVQPNGVFALMRAQNAGCAYMRGQ